MTSIIIIQLHSTASNDKHYTSDSMTAPPDLLSPAHSPVSTITQYDDVFLVNLHLEAYTIKELLSVLNKPAAVEDDGCLMSENIVYSNQKLQERLLSSNLEKQAEPKSGQFIKPIGRLCSSQAGGRLLCNALCTTTSLQSAKQYTEVQLYAGQSALGKVFMQIIPMPVYYSLLFRLVKKNKNKISGKSLYFLHGSTMSGSYELMK